MSEQIVIDREAPPWAQRLQTDLNRVLSSLGIGIRNSAAAIAAPITLADLPSGTVIRRSRLSYATYSSHTTTIPLDDTIPQITEGSEIISGAVTCDVGNVIEFEAVVNFVLSAATHAAAAVFVDAAANAIAASLNVSAAANFFEQIVVKGQFTATATSHTFRVRVGPATASTMYVNGTTADRVFGGVHVSSLWLREIKA